MLTSDPPGLPKLADLAVIDGDRALNAIPAAQKRFTQARRSLKTAWNQWDTRSYYEFGGIIEIIGRETMVGAVMACGMDPPYRKWNRIQQKFTAHILDTGKLDKKAWQDFFSQIGAPFDAWEEVQRTGELTDLEPLLGRLGALVGEAVDVLDPDRPKQRARPRLSAGCCRDRLRD